MATEKKQKTTKEVAAPQVKGKSFTLLKPYKGKKAGDEITAGPKGESDLRSKKIIK